MNVRTLNIVRRLLIVAGIVVMGIAGLALFLPVPNQSVSAGRTSTRFACGPGTSSEPAVFVLVDPNSVNSGQSSVRLSADREVESVLRAERKTACTSAARNRLYTAAVIAAIGLVVMFLGPVALPAWRIERVFA